MSRPQRHSAAGKNTMTSSGIEPARTNHSTACPSPGYEGDSCEYAEQPTRDSPQLRGCVGDNYSQRDECTRNVPRSLGLALVNTVINLRVFATPLASVKSFREELRHAVPSLTAFNLYVCPRKSTTAFNLYVCPRKSTRRRGWDGGTPVLKQEYPDSGSQPEGRLPWHVFVLFLSHSRNICDILH
jgi:hypothetical protein